MKGMKQIDASVLNVGYAEDGPTDAPAVILLHGWPYDIHSNVQVAPLLVEAGYRTIVPYLRTAVEFAIDTEIFHDTFAADLPAEQTAIMAATQRPVAEVAFSEPNGERAWKKLPSWAVVASGDKAAGAYVVRSMAERAGATITHAEGSHVIMVPQPQVVAEAILTAVVAAPRKEDLRAGR